MTRRNTTTAVIPAGKEWEQRMANQSELFVAVRATTEANKVQLAFAKLFGKRAVYVQGDTRLETRRVANTTYVIDKRLTDRRAAKH